MPYPGYYTAYSGDPVSSAFPTMTIEAGFTNGALDEPVTWVDITKYVRQGKISRGRQHELARFDAGTMTLTLTNRDGRFSPFNTGSPYSPNVAPSIPIRVIAAYGHDSWPLFRGQVESWQLRWPSASDSDVVVSAVDATKALNMKSATTISQYRAAVLADSPYLYWRLGDPPGTTTVADTSGNSRTGTVAGAGAFLGAGGAIIADVDGAFDCGNGTGQITGPVSVNQNSVTLEVWAQFRSLPSSGIEGVGAAAALASLSNSSGADQQIDIEINNSFTLTESGVPFVHVDNGLGTIADCVSQVRVIATPFHIPVTIKGDPLVIHDSRWHHYVVTSDGSHVALYVDGVIQLYRAISASAALNTLTVGGFDGAVDDVAVYNYALTEAQAIAHYQAGAAPRQGELSGARIGAYLDAIGWPAALRQIDTGNSPLQAATNDAVGRTVLANTQLVTDSERGQLFVDASGNVTFFDRYHTSRSPYSVVQVALGDGPGEEPYLVEQTQPTFDDTDIWNEVVVTPEGLGPQIAADLTSQARHAIRTLQIRTINASTEEAAARATFDVNQYATPIERVQSVTVTPLSDPTVLYPAVLGLDLLSRVSISRRPLDGASSTFTQEALIEGITHTFDAQTLIWSTTWRLSATDAVHMAIFDDPGTTFDSPYVRFAY